MYAPINNDQRRLGSALLTTLTVIMLVSMAVAASVTLSSGQHIAIMRQREVMRAKLLAEAGANDLYDRIRSNLVAQTISGSLDGYSYTASSFVLSNRFARILSTGVCGNASSTVRLTLYNYGSSSNITFPALNYAFCSGGSLSVGGNATINTGSAPVHSNGSISTSGNACSVQAGTVSASGSISDKKGNISATQVSGVASVEMPDPSVEPYATLYQQALAAGRVLVNPGTMTSWPLSSDPNAIYWIIGSAHFSGQITLSGCLIVTGSLQMTGQASINGNLIVGGGVSGTGNMDINYAAASVPATSSDNVVITAWD